MGAETKKQKDEQSTELALYGLMEKVLSDTRTTFQEKKDLIDELRKNHSPDKDRWAPRVAIWILGASVITTIVCITILAYRDCPVSDGLIAIGSGAAGGLAGLLSNKQLG